MITINYNGRTYIPGNGNSFSMDNIIKYAIADGNLQEKVEEVKETELPEHPKGYLYPETINSYYDTNKTKEWNYQEYQKQLKKAQDEWWAGVKENKEYSSINEFCALNGISEEHRAMLNTFLAIEHTKANSILEKLREELERRINSEEWSTPYMEVKWELEEVLDFVNSLETKENKEPTWVDDLQGISKLIEEDVKKEQFTPGQEIEVSDDGDKWYTSVFKKKEFDGFGCKNDGVWLFARPIEDKIELLPPHEFSYDSQTEFEMIVMQRLELLTNALNQLISK